MASTDIPPGTADVAATENRNGVVAALAAYVFWGFLPLLFHLLSGVDSVLVVAERSAYSLVLVGAILMFTQGFAEVRAVFGDPRRLGLVAISALLLAFNWLVYVWAVDNGRVLEASFGYFINPLMNVALGMILLKERQNFWQAVSIGLGVVAVGIQAVGVGGVPYVALSLALSFAVYGYFRKTTNLGSTSGLFAETLVILPLAIGYIAWFTATTGVGPHGDPSKVLVLLLTGPATALPLLLFAYAVKRLRLTTIGMFQYIAPSIAFVLAITFFQEELNPVRLLSFGLIWLSLAVFTVDAIWRHRSGYSVTISPPAA